VRLHVLLEESVFGSMVRFDIIDTGIGIDENKITRLFEPYDYQVNSVQGLLAQLDMGLQVTAGLPLTKLLTEFLGGTVEVKSQIGIGSTFSLRVPVGTMCELKQSEPGRVQTSAHPVDRDDWQLRLAVDRIPCRYDSFGGGPAGKSDGDQFNARGAGR
jgi:ABC-type antimicrobial peptide transport system permease subunit